MLLERDEQLRTLAGYLADAATGDGRLVFVGGEAGVGKTAFVQAFLDQVGPSARVAMGWSDGSSTPSPLGPFLEMLPDLPDQVWPAGATRHEFFTRLVSALRSPPTRGPYLLVVEDAHWADEATLDLVRHLARRVHSCRALVLVTYRSEGLPADAPLRVVIGDAATMTGTRRLDLAPLTPAAVRALVEDHTRRHPKTSVADAERLHRVTGGNAFFVTEALSAGVTEVPATVRDAVLSRVSRLPAAARRAMDSIALIGPRADVDLVDAVLDDGMEVLDLPLAHGLLRLTGSEVAFRHELARLAVSAEIPAVRRRALHRQILAAMRSRAETGGPVDAARLVHHADAAGDSAAVRTFGADAAAHAASLGAHREAVRQYQRLLRHAGAMPDLERADLLWSLGYECYLTNLVRDALDAVESARMIWADAGDDVRVGDSYRCLSRLNWFAGRNDLAEQQASLAVATLDGSSSIELAMAYSNVAQLRMLSSDTEGTRTWGNRTLDLLAELPAGVKHTEVTVHALNNLGTSEASADDPAEGLRMLSDSLEQSRAADLHEHAARAYCNLLSLAVVQRRHADADAVVEAGLEYCTDRDLDAWTRYLQGWQARLRLDRGDYARAAEVSGDVLRRVDIEPVGQVEPLLVMALVEARTGQGNGTRLLERAARIADGTGEVQRLGPVTSARAELAWLSGHADTSAQAAVALWPTVRDADCRWNRGAVATWLPAGVPIDAGRLAPPFALEVTGRWRAAADLWIELDCPFDGALALARSGEQNAMVEAVAQFERLGAVAAADRTRTLLRTQGWAAPRRPRNGAGRHPAGLTDREAEVLQLLSEGLPDAGIADRLVISRRTVEHHVGAILAKLGVHSRHDAAAAVLD